MPTIAFVIKNERGYRAIAGVTCHVESVPELCIEMTHGSPYTSVLAEAQRHASETETDMIYLGPVDLDEENEGSVGIISLAMVEAAQ